MRTSIAKSLQVRCKIIRKAVNSYNSAALALDPPRPTVDWTKVSHYQFLEEFVLLQDTRNDMREKPWAHPEMRATTKLYRRVQRAEEEIVRLNVEVHRLHTAILDEDVLFATVHQSMLPTNPLCGAIADFALRRQRINAELMQRIDQIYRLPGYSGVQGPGVRLGSGAVAPPPPMTMPNMPLPAEVSSGLADNGDVEEEVDEAVQEQVGVVQQYLSDVAIVAP